jgi:3-methyladenine DNA glycosylase/8-oxoguanine DNA glycosylase
MKKYFNLKGSDKHGYLCQKKDLEKMENSMGPFTPYRSVVAYYMWKVADTKDVYHSNSNSKKQSPKKRKR